MHIYEAYLIEKIKKKKILLNFIEKSISKIPNLPLSLFFSFFIFPTFHDLISHTKLQKTEKGKIYTLLICYSIKFTNKPIKSGKTTISISKI